MIPPHKHGTRMCPCLHTGNGDSHFKLGVYSNDKSHKHLIRVLPQDIPSVTGPQWRNKCDVLPLKMTGSEVTKNIQKTDINMCLLSEWTQLFKKLCNHFSSTTCFSHLYRQSLGRITVT
jgi:hypothetical protein